MFVGSISPSKIMSIWSTGYKVFAVLQALACESELE